MKNIKKAGAYLLALSIASSTLFTSTYADSDVYKLNNPVNGYINAADAKYSRNIRTTYTSGDYYIYKEFNGMYNISKTKNSPGVWINPSDNKNASSTSPIETVVETPVEESKEDDINLSQLKVGDKITVKNTLRTYINASDAKNEANVRGAYSAGDYYIYKIHNGIFNISRTKGSAGAWVNLENNIKQNTSQPIATPNPVQETPSPIEETPVQSNLIVRYVSGGVNVRSEARTSSTKLGQLSRGTKIEGSYVGSWFKFTYNGRDAYVYSTYITANEIAPVNPVVKDKETTIPTTSSKLGQSIADMARRYNGYRYIYGHSNPATGFDCSGLVLYVLNHHGMSAPRSSRDQYSIGRSVSFNNMQAGDLLFFGNTRSSIFHVAIYLGDGTMIHASTPSSGVKIDSVNTNWVRNNLYGVKRVTD